jgi:hypothetical protein
MVGAVPQIGEDFYHAAFVFQHGQRPDDFLKAHLLARVAINPRPVLSEHSSTPGLGNTIRHPGRKGRSGALQPYLNFCFLARRPEGPDSCPAGRKGKSLRGAGRQRQVCCASKPLKIEANGLDSFANRAAVHGWWSWIIRFETSTRQSWNRWLVAARDGPNVRQSFDALWGDYEVGPWRLIGYYSRPVTNRDLHPFDDASSSRNLFYGLRVERHVWGSKELSVYWSRFTNDQASYLSVKGAERRYVWDIRLAGKQGRLDWDIEAMGQTGRFGDRQVSAWAFGNRGHHHAGHLQPAVPQRLLHQPAGLYRLYPQRGRP